MVDEDDRSVNGMVGWKSTYQGNTTSDGGTEKTTGDGVLESSGATRSSRGGLGDGRVGAVNNVSEACSIRFFKLQQVAGNYRSDK